MVSHSHTITTGGKGDYALKITTTTLTSCAKRNMQKAMMRPARSAHDDDRKNGPATSSRAAKSLSRKLKTSVILMAPATTTSSSRFLPAMPVPVGCLPAGDDRLRRRRP